MGLKIAPDPPPPVNVIDKTFSISKFCWSTKTSFRDPDTTGWTSAVVPDPTGGITIFGKLITSKFEPPFNSLTLDNGPLKILSSDL